MNGFDVGKPLVMPRETELPGFLNVEKPEKAELPDYPNIPGDYELPDFPELPEKNNDVESVKVAKPENVQRTEAGKSSSTSLEGETLENNAGVEMVETENEQKTETEIDPKDVLTEEQIGTIRNIFEKLGYSEEEINTKIKEYAEKAKTCQEAEGKGLDNLSKEEKGNYGEMKTDLDLLSKGYVRISENGVTSLKGGHTGIDGVYQNPDGKPPYIIADSKYGTSQLQDTLDGKQLSDTWIDNRLDNEVGKEKADEIREAMIGGEVGVTVAHIDSERNVSYKAVDSNGNIIETQEVFHND